MRRWPDMRQINFDKSTAFSSKRLMFRGIGFDDAQKLVKWRSQKDIYEISGNASPITMEEHLIWFDQYVKNLQELRVMIKEKESGMDIGVVGGVYENDALTLSYYIGETAYRGKGLASEALLALISFIYKTVGILIFRARIRHDNAPSIGCVKKLGFKEQYCDNQLMVYMLDLREVEIEIGAGLI